MNHQQKEWLTQWAAATGHQVEIKDTTIGEGGHQIYGHRIEIAPPIIFELNELVAELEKIGSTPTNRSPSRGHHFKPEPAHTWLIG